MGADRDSSVSRRDLLVGAMVVGAAAALPALARAEKPAEAKAVPSVPADQGLVPRSQHAISHLDPGWALLTGGFFCKRPTGSSLLIDTVGGEIRNAAPMRTARARHASIKLSDGRLLVMGGVNGRFLSSVEMYDSMTNSWSHMPDMPAPMADFVAVETRGGIWLLGGVGPAGALVQGFYSVRCIEVQERRVKQCRSS